MACTGPHSTVYLAPTRLGHSNGDADKHRLIGGGVGDSLGADDLVLLWV